jgi:hypothetical protein
MAAGKNPLPLGNRRRLNVFGATTVAEQQGRRQHAESRQGVPGATVHHDLHLRSSC